jgi:peptidoglycan/LPS O-acetylase OafA/YrhL
MGATQTTNDLHAGEKTAGAEATRVRHTQIDGLRALAMLGVLYVHYLDSDPITENLRVYLFFVVSGFLITHILYSARQSGLHVSIVNFYIRRLIRLMPALLVFVLAASIFDMGGFRSSALWHVAQLSNVYFAMTEKFTPWVAAHLWSLNCLEHFYLLWPLVILCLPIARVYTVTLTLICGFIFIRANGSFLGVNGWWTALVLPFDPIASGALAYLLMQQAPILRVMRSRLAVFASIAVLASPFVLWEGFGNSESYRLLIQPALCIIVVGAFQGYNGLVGRILGSRIAQFVSTISYGVYIYHMAVWWLVGEVYVGIYQKGPVSFLVLSLLTSMVATISWYLLERPVSKLRRWFPTTSIRTTSEGQVAPG